MKTSALLAAACAALIGHGAIGRSSDKDPDWAPEIIPLKALGEVPATNGFLTWAEPVVVDDAGNAYFLVGPTRDHQRDPADTPVPRDVLRISADGKTHSKLSPLASPKLAKARLSTSTIALAPDGMLSMLTWARWPERGLEEDGAQYIVSFKRDGEYGSELKVTAPDLGATQFEVFTSGEYLIRGQSLTTGQSRLAVLSASGSEAQEVVTWPGLPEAGELDQSSSRTELLVGQMTRADDGRIYVTQQGTREGEHVVFAISPSGYSERRFTLRRLPGNPRLVSLKSAAGRLAATYVQPRTEKSSSQWRIAVYSNTASDGEPPLAVYGSAPGTPISYKHEGGDRFTFLKGGKFVTMSP